MSARDATLIFSSAQSLVDDSGHTQISTNIIDLTGGTQDYNGFWSTISPNIGECRALYVVMVLSATLTITGGSLAVHWYDHTGTTITSGTKRASVYFATGAAAKTTQVMLIPIADMARYGGLVYECVSAACTAGTMEAWIDIIHQSPV